MGFRPLQPAPNLDTDGLRQHGEDQHREIERAWTELDGTISDITTDVAGKVSKTGDTMSGPLTVTGTVTATTLAATGNLTVGGNATVTGDLTIDERRRVRWREPR
jgi:hypothetical protein